MLHVSKTDDLPPLAQLARQLVPLLAVTAVLAVDEVFTCSALAALVVSFLHHGDVALAPVDDQRLSDEEEHNTDLCKGEEAPDGSLLHQVIGDEGSHDGAEEEEEDALDHHALLLVQSEERGEHEERVDACSHDVVRGIGHGHGPAKMSHALGLECAQLVPTQPLGGLVVAHVHSVERWDVRQEISAEKKHTSNQTQPLDNVVAVLVLATLGQRCVDHVAVVRLQTDVQESQQSQHLVDDIVTVRVAEASGKEHVLNGLEKLHGEEEEHACTGGEVG
jgi:hypothetical protein